MLNPARLIRRLRSLLTSRQEDVELDEEMRFHLEMETENGVQRGLTREEAELEARRAFGGGQFRDASRDARGVRPVEDFLQDVRVGSRGIIRQRTYAVVAVATLALGIGATTALFAAVYRVLLQPFPFPEPDRIVTLWQHDPMKPGVTSELAPANYFDLKARSRSFSHLAAAEPYGFDWIGPDGPRSFSVALVTADFFPIQGLRPLLGRTFVPEEFEPGRNYAVVLSEHTWRTRFGSDSSIVGRQVTLDTTPRVVVGVMSEDAMRPYDAEMWAPKIFRPEEQRMRTGGFWTVTARLAPGVSMSQARDEMNRLSAQMADENPATNKNTAVAVVKLREAIVGDGRRTLLVLLGAVAFVLLIACVNVANLQLAESLRRQRELAIRTAIGAGRGRLVRQLLTESLLVASAGAAAGLVVAWWGIGAIRAFAPPDLWLLQRLRFDTPAVLFAMALAVLSAIAVGIMPVLAAGRIRLSDSLAAGRRSGGSKRARSANRALVVAEVALALVLMVGAGLLLRSLSSLMRNERGYQTDGLLVATMQTWSFYPTAPLRAEFVRLAVERLGALPGVERVGMVSSLPLSWPIGLERTRATVEGLSVASADEQPVVRAAAATSGYFEAMRIPLQRGRPFATTDVAGSTPIAIVNAAFVRQYFGDQDPIGKRVTMGFMSQPVAREIVGVVGDVRHEGLQAAPTPSVWIPHAQGSTGATHLVLRVLGDPATYERVVRAELTSMNGAMPLSEITTMNARLSETLRQRRFQLNLLAAFSAMALVLSAIGIYGVMSRVTGERTHEIGVRLAVGAGRGDVRMMVLRSGGALALAGIGVGSALALVLTRSMQGMLYDVSPLDLPTYLGAAALLLVVAVLACLVPALRASSVDPVVALRND
jgi:predicted permease